MGLVDDSPGETGTKLADTAPGSYWALCDAEVVMDRWDYSLENRYLDAIWLSVPGKVGATSFLSISSGTSHRVAAVAAVAAVGDEESEEGGRRDRRELAAQWGVQICDSLQVEVIIHKKLQGNRGIVQGNLEQLKQMFAKHSQRRTVFLCWASAPHCSENSPDKLCLKQNILTLSQNNTCAYSGDLWIHHFHHSWFRAAHEFVKGDCNSMLTVQKKTPQWCQAALQCSENDPEKVSLFGIKMN